MHIHRRISAHLGKFPLFIQRFVNKRMNKKWPIWGYHTNSKNLFLSMEKFLNDKGTEWEYAFVKSYYQVYIFDKDTAEQFAKKFGFRFA